MPEGKEPFVSSEDRPAVHLNPDTPITELRVRDLHTLIQSGVQFKYKEWKLERDKIEFKIETDKHFVDNKWPDVPKSPKEIYEGGGTLGNVGDPFQAIDQVIKALSGLSQQMAQLNEEVRQLKQRSGGA